MSEVEYVLGTSPSELERLGLQHDAWRNDAEIAWRTAGFREGDHLLDLGCGPGFATLDLARIVGASGSVTAVDQSSDFLAHLRARTDDLGLENVKAIRADLAHDDLPLDPVDGVWIRWVLAFLPSWRDIVARVARRVKPGGRFAIHEYFDYGAWRLVPHDDVFERFVDAVIRSWRKSGGEPDIGVPIAQELQSLGFTITGRRLISTASIRGDDRWRWLSTFARSAPNRLVELGEIDTADAEAIRASVDRAEANGSWMISPGVIEVVATRPI
jgi:ubiquinone/menaquinone biosynthesis C-methylase UbiE